MRALRKFQVLVALTALATLVRAVEPGLPSKTAVWAAAARAIGAKHSNPALRNPDYLAIRSLGPSERAILPEYPMDALDLDYASAMTQFGSRMPVMSLAFRTKAFDSAMLEALQERAGRSSFSGQASTVLRIASSHNCEACGSWKSTTCPRKSTRKTCQTGARIGAAECVLCAG
jgi:hypothetical protein